MGNMEITMDEWVKEHSINGPSPVEFEDVKENEIHLFYDIDNDAWAVIDNLEMLQFIRDLYGVYYIVFKDEFIKYLKSK